MLYGFGMIEKVFEGWIGVWEERWKEIKKGDCIIFFVLGMVGMGVVV